MLPDDPDEDDGFLCAVCNNYDFKPAVIGCIKCRMHVCSNCLLYSVDTDKGDHHEACPGCGVSLRVKHYDWLVIEARAK